jgi:hypothetical protein
MAIQRPSITSMAELRRAFWRDNPSLSRRKVRSYSGTGTMHTTDTRVAFVDWLDHQARAGAITEDLASRATL